MPSVITRTCCACGAKLPQAEMRRISTKNGGNPNIDSGRKGAGRGAYLCFDAACVSKALQRKSLERALKLQNPLSNEFKNALRNAQ
ncbi:hypothetical protein B1R32_103185 [Abditibacterium utsteinense]|uniref:YlxR domain-containing protein n=1 Tax=Abditibacterium utsteinense TaxID=1960156 RepID=A0A2S8SVV3_9BACT|nr:YlxR family protein [Abditibacterium utsteinense]PQV64918.1 hypothetical protein B1R32_103185 [Abditibacterium utsteinense]